MNRPCKTFFFIPGTLFILFYSCTKDVGQLPKPVINACDTITYQKQIGPLLQNNCAVSNCHTGQIPTAGIALDTYDQAINLANIGKLENVTIKGTPYFMPPGSKPPLTAEQKNLIKCWLENGKKP